MAKKKKYEVVVIGVIVLLSIILAIIGVIANQKRDLKQLLNVPISNVDLTKMDDGIYTGSYEWSPVDAVVNVTIDDHVITGIDLIKHTHEKGAPAEVIPGKVVESQSLEIDMVAGATYSSKVILKAIENALNSSPK